MMMQVYLKAERITHTIVLVFYVIFLLGEFILPSGGRCVCFLYLYLIVLHLGVLYSVTQRRGFQSGSEGSKLSGGSENITLVMTYV